MRRRQVDTSGFTLLELMVVIGLMGVLLAFTLPATARFMSSGRLAGAASVLTTDIHYAHSLAASERKTYQIQFSSNSYSLYRVSPPETTRTRALPKGVTCTASDTATFYPWGLTDPITISLTNERGTSVVRVLANGNVSHE